MEAFGSVDLRPSSRFLRRQRAKLHFNGNLNLVSRQETDIRAHLAEIAFHLHLADIWMGAQSLIVRTLGFSVLAAFPHSVCTIGGRKVREVVLLDGPFFKHDLLVAFGAVKWAICPGRFPGHHIFAMCVVSTQHNPFLSLLVLRKALISLLR